MSQNGIEYLEGKIGESIDYCRSEFDLNYAEIVGVLTIVIDTIIREMREIEDE